MLDRTAHEDSGQCFVSDRLRQLAVDLFASLRAASFDGIGVSRETYGQSETEAMETVASAAAREGLAVEWDEARNLAVSLPGQNPELPAAAHDAALCVARRGKRVVRRAVLFRIAGVVRPTERG